MCTTCAETAKLIQEWVDQQGHNRCWYYPDLFNKLAALHQVKPKVPPSLPPLVEFKEGCTRFQSEEYKPLRDP